MSHQMLMPAGLIFSFVVQDCSVSEKVFVFVCIVLQLFRLVTECTIVMGFKKQWCVSFPRICSRFYCNHIHNSYQKTLCCL